MPGIFASNIELYELLMDEGSWIIRLNPDPNDTYRLQFADAFRRLQPLQIDEDVLDHPIDLISAALLEVRSKAINLAADTDRRSKLGLRQGELEVRGELREKANQVAETAATLLDRLTHGGISTFYHYCSVASFHSIITNCTIRLFDPQAMNDTMEGAWARRFFVRLCQDSGLTEAHIALIEKYFDEVDAPPRAIMCFSQDGDLLSQWRGYADDGRGFAIGFGRDIASLTPDKPRVLFEPVMYDERIQRRALSQYVQRAADALNNNLDKALAGVVRDVELYAYRIKNPQFREELEWRLIEEVSEPYSGYHPRGNRLVPYREYSLRPKTAQHSPVLIKEIVLGPKNETPIDVVRKMVPKEFNGNNEIEILKSATTYR